jgi:tRNA 2-thiouridine synthesizing protein A
MSEINPIIDMDNIDKTLDCTGVKCPMPIVRTSQAVKTLTVGQILQVSASDPAFEIDINAWSDKTGHKIIKLFCENDITYALIQVTG